MVQAGCTVSLQDETKYFKVENLKGMEREYATALDTMCDSLLVFSWITPICQKEKINKINKYITIIKLFVAVFAVSNVFTIHLYFCNFSYFLG